MSFRAGGVAAKTANRSDKKGKKPSSSLMARQRSRSTRNRVKQVSLEVPRFPLSILYATLTHAKNTAITTLSSNRVTGNAPTRAVTTISATVSPGRNRSPADSSARIYDPPRLSFYRRCIFAMASVEDSSAYQASSQ